MAVPSQNLFSRTLKDQKPSLFLLKSKRGLYLDTVELGLNRPIHQPESILPFYSTLKVKSIGYDDIMGRES